MNLDEERKAFLEYWRENNLPYEGDDADKEKYFEYWQAAKAQESEKLKGYVVVSSDDVEKITNYLALAGCHPNNSADDENDIYGLMEKIEAERDGK